MKAMLFAALAATWGTVALADSLTWSDSGIKGPPYAKQLADMEGLRDRHSDLVTIFDYGKSVQGRTLRMVVAMKNPGVDVGPRPTFVMSGSTHGNEYLNLEDRIPAELLRRSRNGGPVANFLDAGGALVFVPILNPDGYESRKRDNAHGVDLNRDWDLEPAGHEGFKEAETKTLKAMLEILAAPPYRLSYKVTVDYHCCIGALLHPWSYQKAKLPDTDLAAHQAIGELAKRHLNSDVGATGEVLGYFPVGTTKDWYYLQYGAVAFTYEGRFKKENELFPQHVAWWESMIDHVSRLPPRTLFGLRNKRPPIFPLFAD